MAVVALVARIRIQVVDGPTRSGRGECYEPSSLALGVPVTIVRVPVGI